MGRSLFVVRPPEEVLSQRDRLAAYLSRTEGRFRVYSPSYSVPHHTGARYGLEQLDGVDPSQVRWLAHYMALAGGYEMAAYSVTVPVFPSGAADWQTALRNADLDPVLLGLMNGRFVVAEFPLSVPGLRLVDQIDGAYLYENERCWPRAFLMTRTERVADWQAAQERFATGFDPAQGALVETGAVLDGPPGWQAARIVSFAPNRIVVAAEAKRASLLVLGEVWYPGWRVTVDGVEQPIERVYGLMRGVYLAPGVHEVVWVYRPPTLWWGIGIALVSLAGLVVCSAWTCGKRRGGEASR